LKTSDFDYSLPQSLIASEPLARRDASRMMVLERAARKIHHAKFLDLAQWLRAGDLLVLNDTKVMPARLPAVRERADERGQIARSHIEVLLLEERAPALWEALVRPGQKVHLRDRILFGGGEFAATVEDNTDFGGRVLRFENSPAAGDLMEKHGLPPLPHYIEKAREGKREDASDRERYQTVYARTAGAVAAPTAGLHFTEQTFQQLKAMGVGVAHVTLHVGLGTFRPVQAENVEEHVMHRERFSIPAETLRAIAETKAHGGRVVAVGTTVVRTLEAGARRAEGVPQRGMKPEAEASENSGLGSQVSSPSGTTDIFIHPPFAFKVVDALLTNFHLPKSTLLMLVSAFASPNKTEGREFVLRAYAEAVRAKYRFYSYGDCMLVM